jgi:hypothetical protein
MKPKRVEAHREGSSRLSSTGRYAAAAPGFLTLLLPKCPMCWAGILALLGIHSAFAAAVLYPVAFCCLAPAAGLLAINARRRGGWGPFSLYSIAGVILISGRLLFDNQYVTGSGVLAMLAAIVWNGLPQVPSRKCACLADATRIPPLSHILPLSRIPPLPHIPRIQAPRHAQLAGSLHNRAPIPEHRQLTAVDEEPQRILIRAHFP